VTQWRISRVERVAGAEPGFTAGRREREFHKATETAAGLTVILLRDNRAVGHLRLKMPRARAGPREKRNWPIGPPPGAVRVDVPQPHSVEERNPCDSSELNITRPSRSTVGLQRPIPRFRCPMHSTLLPSSSITNSCMTCGTRLAA